MSRVQGVGDLDMIDDEKSAMASRCGGLLTDGRLKEGSMHR